MQRVHEIFELFSVTRVSRNVKIGEPLCVVTREKFLKFGMRTSTRHKIFERRRVLRLQAFWVCAPSLWAGAWVGPTLKFCPRRGDPTRIWVEPSPHWAGPTQRGGGGRASGAPHPHPKNDLPPGIARCKKTKETGLSPNDALVFLSLGSPDQKSLLRRF